MSSPQAHRAPALPRLGVVHHRGSVDLLSLVQASRGRWHNVWLIPAGAADHAQIRQLGRFGDVAHLDDQHRPLDPDLELHGLLATTDATVITAAALAKQLGLKYFDQDDLARLNQKDVQRAALRAAGVPSPRCVRVPSTISAAELAAATAGMRFPAIVKPASGTGSRHTSEVGNVEEGHRRLSAHPGPSEDYVIEERIADGWPPEASPWADYVSVESFATRTGIEHFGITGRGALAEGFRETASIMPSAVPAELHDELFALTTQAIRALSDAPGVFHTEIKLSPDGPRVIEVNGRLGGGSIEWLAERVTGSSLLAAAGQLHLGRPPLPDPIRFNGVGFAYYVQPPLGATELIALRGLEEVAALAGVEEVIPSRHPGEQLNPSAEGSMGFLAVIRGWAPSHAEVADLFAQIRDLVEVSYRC